jgi:hypothetical protein
MLKQPTPSLLPVFIPIIDERQMRPTDGPGIAEQETPINIGALLDAYEEDIIA